MSKEFIEALKARIFPLEFVGHYVNGVFEKCAKGSLVKDVINPSNGEVLTTVRLERALLESGLSIAESYESRFGTMALNERFELLKKFRQGFVDYRELIIHSMQLEGGKPLWEAEIEFSASLRFMDMLLEQEEHLFAEILAPLKTSQQNVTVSLEPVGTVLAHIPFTTPCTSFVKFLAVAVVSGDPLVVVSSAHAALFSSIMAHVVSELEFPAGVVSILCGNFEMFRAGCQDKRVKAVIYRGSREHCTTIRQEGFDFIGRPMILQSGGKNATLVHQSAKLEMAAKMTTINSQKTAALQLHHLDGRREKGIILTDTGILLLISF